MQSWKTASLVLSFTLAFSYAANQTTADAGIASLKDVGKSNKTIESTNFTEAATIEEAITKQFNLTNENKATENEDENIKLQNGATEKSQTKITNTTNEPEALNVFRGDTKSNVHEQETGNITFNENQFNVQNVVNATSLANEEVNKNEGIHDQHINKSLGNNFTNVKQPALRSLDSEDKIVKHEIEKDSKLKPQIILSHSEIGGFEINKKESVQQLPKNKENIVKGPDKFIGTQNRTKNKLHDLVDKYDESNAGKVIYKHRNITKNFAKWVRDKPGKAKKSNNRLYEIINRRKHFLRKNKFVRPNAEKVINQEVITNEKKSLNEYGNKQYIAGNKKANGLMQSSSILKNPSMVKEGGDSRFETLKKQLITSIMNKTSALVIKLTKNRYPSEEEKARVLIIIKEKVLKKVSPLSERYALWTDIITQGVDATFAKLRHSMKITVKINETKDYKKEPALRGLGSAKPNNCEILTQRACTQIIGLNLLACDSGNKSVTIEKLCDGIYDCEDGSDEIKCSDKAIRKLKQAEKIVEDAESSSFIDCFKYDEGYLAKKKSDSLRKIVARQISLIAHCIDSPLVKMSIRGQTRNRMILEQGSNQIAMVISSVSLSLDGAICTELVNNDNDYDNIVKRVDEREDTFAFIDDEHYEEWSYRSCKCSGKVCVVHPCHEHCKTVCHHKHSLGQMVCRSFNSDTSISLDLICDGKIDCEDESDEKDCSEGNAYARFKGFNSFDQVGQWIQIKVHTKYFSPVRRKLFRLQNSVMQLQKLSAHLAIDKKAIKSARNKAFDLLGSIYVDMLTRVSTFNETEDVFAFLISINEELIKALKYSHTGNERLVPSEDCDCRGTICIVPFCSEYCIRACSVQPSFMTLACKKQPEVKVDLPKICDGKKDCPAGDDEKLCDKDVCRKHHFMLLHTRLKQELSTSFGSGQNLLSEILKTWKRKAISIVKTAEVAVIASSDNFKMIVKTLLHDLVMAYSFTDEVKGDPQQLYTAFYNVSQQVLKLVDYCGAY